jgi:hypothetical protein
VAERARVLLSQQLQRNTNSHNGILKQISLFLAAHYTGTFPTCKCARNSSAAIIIKKTAITELKRWYASAHTHSSASNDDEQFIREPNFLPPSVSLSLSRWSWREREARGGEAISCDVVKEKCAARSARAQFSHYYFSLFDARAMEKFVISFSVHELAIHFIGRTAINFIVHPYTQTHRRV